MDSKEVDIILREPAQWSQWFRKFNRQARALDIFKYVDIETDGPELTKPTMPTEASVLDDFHDQAMKIHERTLQAWEQLPDDQRQVQLRPTTPTRQATLDDIGFKTLAARQNQHRIELSVYNTERDAYSKLNVWITNNVDHAWLQLTPETGVIRDIVRSLRDKLSLTDEREKERVRQVYKQALKGARRSVNPEEWFKRWDLARLDGEKQEISEVEGQLAITDFLDATANIFPGWSERQKTFFNNNQVYGLGSTVTLQQVGQAFITEYRTLAIKKASGSAFPAVESPSNSNSSNKHDCPCGSRHPWKSINCDVAWTAVTGQQRPGAKRHVGQKKVDATKANLDDTKWKRLIDQIKAKAQGSQTGQAPQTGNAEHVAPNANFVAISPVQDHAANFALTKPHPLRDSTIVDGGSTAHIANDEKLFVPGSLKPTDADDYLLVGDTNVQVQGRGQRIIEKFFHGPSGPNSQPLILNNVAYVPNFHLNIIALDLLEEKGVHRNSWDNTLRHGGDGMGNETTVVANLKKMYNLVVAEYKPLNSSYFCLPRSNAGDCVYFATKKRIRRRPRRTNKDPKPPRSDTAELWHLRAGHLGPEALMRLVQYARNVKIKGIPTKECKACAVTKATHVVSRLPSENRSRQPFWRICIDLFQLPVAFNGHQYSLNITDEYSGRIDVFTMAHKSDAFDIILDYEARVKRQYGLPICKIRIDNERSLISLEGQRDTAFQRWAKDEGIDIEVTPTYTKEPNGTAERSGGVIGQMSRTMRVSSNLPEELWTESWQAAAFIHNRAPCQHHDWRSPNEVLERWFRSCFRWYNPYNNNGSLSRDFRSDWNGTYAYGARAYPLIRGFKAGKDKKHFKINPRAHIGYLVGYRASNIYRIWVPALREVITTRDVTFDEDAFFDPEEEQRTGLLISEYRPMAETLAIPDIHVLEGDLDEFVDFEDEDTVDESDQPVETEGDQASGVGEDRSLSPASDGFHPFPTPEPTPIPESPVFPPDARFEGDVLSERDQRAAEGGRELVALKSISVNRPLEPPEGPDQLPGAVPEGGNELVTQEDPLEPPAGAHQPPGDDPDEMAESARATSRMLSDSDQTDTASPATMQEESRDGARPETGRSERRKRRTQQEVWGAEPSRRSQRTPKPTEKAASGQRASKPPDNAAFATFSPDDDTNLWDLCPAFFGVFFASMDGKHRWHRDNLTKIPKTYKDLAHHPLGPEFKEACRVEIRNLLKKRTWHLVKRDVVDEDNRVLPLKWVFLYKFDEDGNLTRCKARIVVRGDLQEDTLANTHAATLAAKSFRVAMAIAAKFDLECKQYDVTNAFLNSAIDRSKGRVFCKLPDGYGDLGFFQPNEDPSMVADLHKALYGLRDSPALWYNELASSWAAAGLTKSTEEPCVFVNDKVLVLVYVDDILVMYRKEHEGEAMRVIGHLKDKYEMRDEGDIKWFLGIRVIRDRSKRKIWLCQDGYIEKITRKFGLLDKNSHFPSIPLPTEPLKRFTGRATAEEVRSFQEKIGSVLYAAVTVRPDVAKAASQLSRFLTNPAPEHHKAADQAILYLYATRFLAIEYNGRYDEALVIASDASFADDEETRRSSQGYVMTLFGGPVNWKAGLQDTVTTSTTEAELLGVERTAKESYALMRFMRDISLDLGQQLKLYCDNQQTIRLIVDEGQRISTKLRHVDIQNMWLRQEFRKGKFFIEYLPTGRMPADGLTKALSRQKFEHFRNLLNLQDVQRLVESC